MARDQCANDAKARALVGIYFDAGSSPQNAGSLTAYDPARPFSAENLTLATLVQEDVLRDMNAQGWGIPNDGVLPDTTLGSYVGDPSAGGIAGEAASYDHLLLLGPVLAGYFSTPSQMPGAVIEPLYLTDPFEGSIADTGHGQSDGDRTGDSTRDPDIPRTGPTSAPEEHVGDSSLPRSRRSR